MDKDVSKSNYLRPGYFRVFFTKGIIDARSSLPKDNKVMKYPG